MLFAHAPKLVLAGPYPMIRPVADRAAALDAEVVVLSSELTTPIDDIVGFDWAVVAIDAATPTAVQLDRAVHSLASGLRRGALVVVASDRPVTQAAKRFADDLAEASGLATGESFAVAAYEVGVVAWAADAQAEDEAAHLLQRIGAPVGGGVPAA
ncbi:hypothetical protein [Frigoribacterium sp. VKM Ac-2836]|uniref:hypothetical protein n=1 Tax=Frigoribacterium sp. VKM Ac-2836 TaxID=2739014 RepID=UPI0015639350|nr:hypothetical protein [Frigoribacterium sp. VKM Ac-2836]NRD27884.1 hypothetical protein [Frigoribacterium sp. VKM Ac-2836]